MTNPKKVLLVVTKSNLGGAQRYCFDLARELSKRGLDVAVAHGSADGKPGRLASLLLEKDIRSISLPSLVRDVHPLRDISALGELVTLFRKERPDIVHLNSSKAGGLGALAGRIAGVSRIVFTLHGAPHDEARSMFSRVLIVCMTWLTILFSHVTITISARDYERMRRLPFTRRKVTLIRNGVVSPTFLSPRDARKELRSLDPTLPEDGVWIGLVGELHANKNQALAVRALATLPDAHLVLIGEGEERVRLTAMSQTEHVSSRVHLLGFIPEAAQYLRAFDCITLPSQKEGLPYVLLEAGCAYVPVVATEVGGIPDIIVHDFTGLLVTANDALSLSEALQRIVTDATLARSLSEELLKRVRNSFSLEAMVEKTLTAYRLNASASNTA